MKYGLKIRRNNLYENSNQNPAAVRHCNLCNHPFQIRTTFDRYCKACKGKNELFKFSEWLPNLTDFQEDINEKLSA